MKTMYKMYSRIQLLIGLLLFLSLNEGVTAQISLSNPNISPTEVVNDILLGSGVVATNIRFNGSPVQANTPQSSVHGFTNTSATFPLEGGVLMETNNGSSLSDPDLSALTSNTIKNGSIIEFDFVPDGDTLSFSYIFASSEYSSFTCTRYNDVFGFFISGPGISGPFSNNAQNIATVPGSNNIPVAVNTVNSGVNSDLNNYCHNADPNWQSNSSFFTTSYNTVYSNSNLSSSSYFNGSTIELTANAKVQCGETYHIKLAITNTYDQAFDSGVFLRAGSFSSVPSIDILGNNTTSSFLDSVIVEGCDEGNFCFSRPIEDASDTAVVHYTFSGTATYGDDYTIPNLPNLGDSIVLLPGDTLFCLDIILNDDTIDEGLEFINLTTFNLNPCGDTLYSIGELWIADHPEDLNTNAGQDTVVCNGGTALLQGQALSSNDYKWTYTGPGTITFTPNNMDLNAEASFDTAGEYLLILTESNDTCALQNVDTMIVYYGEVELEVSNDTTVCENGEATLVGIGYGGNSLAYHWSHTSNTDSIQLVQPTGQEDYTVYAQNSSGCTSDTLTISVDVLPPLTVISGPAQAICPGDETEIFAEISGGNGGPYNYEWTDPSGNVVGTMDTIVVAPLATTTYTITATDGCESSSQTATTEVIFDALPDVLFSVDESAICTPATFQLTNDSDPLLVDKVYWKISDGQSFDLLDTVDVEIKKSGLYNVQLTVVTPNGCIDSATTVGMLTVYPKPRVDFSYIPKPVTILNTKVQFQNATYGAAHYDWNFEGGTPDYSSLEDPTIQFPEGVKDSYDVTLIATSEFNCIDSVMKTIDVEPEVLIFAPNAFTPDGDEYNNVWKPEVSGVNIYGVTIQIFNRWGEMVWESHNLDYGWDGTYGAGGQMVEPGVYIWKIEASDRITDNKYEWNGQVNVIY